VTDKRPDAIDESREVLALATRRHGERNPDTLAIAIGLSNLLRATDEVYHEEALELATATLDRFTAVYGNDHPYYYGCLTNLALLKRATGDAAAAYELNEKALRGLTSLGQSHHYALTAAMNLASDLAALDRLAEARAIGEETLKRLTEQLGATHANTLGCAANLSLDMIALGDEEDGNELRSKALRLLADPPYGTDSPDYVAAASRDRLEPDFDPPAI
jgi:tetratricopeptide (TPR) repeat protein